MRRHEDTAIAGRYPLIIILFLMKEMVALMHFESANLLFRLTDNK